MTPVTAAESSPTSIPVARVHLWPLTAITIFLTAVADYLFWHETLGVSIGIFVAALGLGIVALRGSQSMKAGGWVALLLLLGACVQSGIQLCLTNICVLTALWLVLAGGTYFTELAPAWRRWIRQLRSVLLCVERLPWLSSIWVAQRPATHPEGPGGGLSRLMLILAPAAVLLVVFAVILSGGNVVFNEMLSKFGERTTDWILRLEFSPWRLAFWLLGASVILSFLRPGGQNAASVKGTLGLWQRKDPRLAWLQSLIALVGLNALFALVNTIDLVDLWGDGALPEGLSRKEFLHAGVNNLIAATVLAAIVLAGMFQQSREVTKSRALQGLAYLWMLQNLLLGASVYRRDYLYVMETHLLTEKRVYVLCFLGLVALGYCFLALQVHRGGGLGRLIWRNTLAAFSLFYVMQFLDVSGMVSRWCAEKSAEDLTWGFDVNYWSTQGPAAWPALQMVANGPEAHPQRNQAREYVKGLVRQEKARTPPDWRAWQWLEARNREKLIGEEARSPSLR